MRAFTGLSLVLGFSEAGGQPKIYKLENQECITKGGDYFGTIAVTKSGRKCKKWSEVKTPLKSVDYFEVDHNYCRLIKNGFS